MAVAPGPCCAVCSPQMRPRGGREIWELGIERYWADLGTLLKDSCAELWWVVDAYAEDRLSRVRREIDASRDPADSRGLVFGLASGSEKAHKLLKRVLALGAHPDLPADNGERPSHLASFHLLTACVEALSLCRANFAAKAVGRTPRVYAELAFPLPGDAEKQEAKTRILEIWSNLEANGFPSIAKLASQREFWAVKNLCRRRAVPKAEIRQLHDGKDVFQWAEEHGEYLLLEELHYLLGSPILEALLKEVKFLRTKVAEFEARPTAESRSADFETKEWKEIEESVAACKSECAEARAAAEDGRKAISRRLETFQRDQDSKIQELRIAFDELAVDLREAVEARAEVPEDAARLREMKGRKAGEKDDPLRMVVSGLLTKVESISASATTYDLVEDLLGLVKKHCSK